MDEFQVNLLRMVVAQLYQLNRMAAARDMFDKGYFALGAGEQAIVEQTLGGQFAALYQWATAESLASLAGQQPAGTVGFGIHHHATAAGTAGAPNPQAGQDTD